MREDERKEAGPRQRLAEQVGRGGADAAERRNGFGQELGGQGETPHWVVADLGAGIWVQRSG